MCGINFFNNCSPSFSKLHTGIKCHSHRGEQCKRDNIMNMTTVYPNTFLGFLILMAFLVYSCNGSGQNNKIQQEVLKDSDGNEYATVTIGQQTWMAENLRTAYFGNGDRIPQVTNREAWYEAGYNEQAAWAYYDFNPENGIRYGKLYNWYAVVDPRGLAPEGWEVPDIDQWRTLIDELGGEPWSYVRLKSEEGWINDRNGTNSSGFGALPSGTINPFGASTELGESTYWWSASEFNQLNGYRFRLLSQDSRSTGLRGSGKGHGLSLRLIKTNDITD